MVLFVKVLKTLQWVLQQKKDCYTPDAIDNCWSKATKKKKKACFQRQFGYTGCESLQARDSKQYDCHDTLCIPVINHNPLRGNQ